MTADVNGNILWLRCSICGVEFPTFVFSGENDWITAGLRTKTDFETKTLYVYEHSDDAPPGTEVELVRSEHVPSSVGESFQEYRDRIENSRERCVYRCACCGNDSAERTERLSTSELESKEYKLVELIR